MAPRWPAAWPLLLFAAFAALCAAVLGDALRGPFVSDDIGGSEAVEAALKLAEKVQGPNRATVLYAENSFHGKTCGALSVTDSDFYQSTFQLLANRKRILFGDLKALDAVLSTNPSVGTIILETVQGGAGIITAEPDYWRGVRDLCDRHKVLWIADEVQCGVGRTGKFFAFEHAGVIPDIVTLAKSLGGGKSAMGAMIARRPIYMQACVAHG